MAVNDPHLSVRQSEGFGEVPSLSVELEKRGEVSAPHSVVQPAGVGLFSAQDIPALSVLRHNVLLSSIPGQSESE